MSYTHITTDERYFIYHMNMVGWSKAEIARRIGRDRSTIGRELKRNANFFGHYFNDIADAKAKARRRESRVSRVTGDWELMAWVKKQLQNH